MSLSSSSRVGRFRRLGWRRELNRANKLGWFSALISMSFVISALICPHIAHAEQPNVSSGSHVSAGSNVSSSETRAPRVQLQLTDNLILDARDDNKNGQDRDDNYQLAINRFTLGGSVYGTALRARLDTMHFWDAPTSEFQGIPARLERLYLAQSFFTSDQFNLKLELGDFYTQLGNGQVLALRNVDELGLDVTLRGAHATITSGTFELRMFGGVSNVVNIDMISMHRIEDRADLIGGGQASYVFMSGVEIGALYAYVQPEEQSFEGLGLPDANSSVGGYLKYPGLTDFLDLELEIDMQQRRLNEAVQEGSAGYLKLDWYLGDTSLLTELLWVDNFRQQGSSNSSLGSEFNYNLGPNLERIDQEVFELYDVRGARARVEHELVDQGVTFHANALYRLNKPDDPMEISQYHGFGGLKWHTQDHRSSISGSGGHRIDLSRGYISRVWSHAEGGVQHNFKGVTASLKTMLQWIQIEQNPKFTRGSTILGLTKSGVGAVNLEWGVDDQNRSPGVRQSFWAGIFKWEVARFLMLQGVIGNQRGGIKCINGVCRDYPEFSGYRLQVIFKHPLVF